MEQKVEFDAIPASSVLENSPADLPQVNSDRSIENKVPAETLNRLHVRFSEYVAELPSDCIHLMAASPPCIFGKEYDNELTLDQCRRLLRKFGEKPIAYRWMAILSLH